MKQIRILAIESSCDETAAAVIGINDNIPVILSNIVSSQVDLHAKTGGVVPEVASRAHMEAIIPVITEALIQARQHVSKTANQQENQSSSSAVQLSSCPADLLKDISHIAVTAGPGLIGSLLVGFNAAKSITYALDKPIIPINHIEGHIYSVLASDAEGQRLKIKGENEKASSLRPQALGKFNFPLLALVVSGGHTSLVLAKDHGDYEVIGETVDDAAGEAFDKVAILLNLGYPGGPVISKLANKFRDDEGLGPKAEGRNYLASGLKPPASDLVFPRPMINDGTFNFSFSGLKTAVLTEVKRRSDISDDDKYEIAAAFEDAAVDVLVTKTMRAIEKYQPKSVVLAGGVAANRRLRDELGRRLEVESKKGIASGLKPQALGSNLRIPPLSLCGDNAAMIGLAAYYHIQKGNTSTWDKVRVDSSWGL